jgi:hypothetical protein
MAGLAALALTSIGFAVVFVMAGSLGLFGAAQIRRLQLQADHAIPAPKPLGDHARRWVGARKYISARFRIKVTEKPDPKIQIEIQRAVDDAREYSMRLQYTD